MKALIRGLFTRGEDARDRVPVRLQFTAWGWFA